MEYLFAWSSSYDTHQGIITCVVYMIMKDKYIIISLQQLLKWKLYLCINTEHEAGQRKPLCPVHTHPDLHPS